MALSVNEELRRTFELAALRREGKSIDTPHQWREVGLLQRRCKRAMMREKDLYAARYHTRVETARRRLIDQAGDKTQNFKPWWGGSDRFDPQATLRQAQRDVRNAHAARVERIAEFERQSLKTLLDRFRRENAVHGLAREEFSRAADRRNGVERRRVRLREH